MQTGKPVMTTKQPWLEQTITVAGHRYSADTLTDAPDIYFSTTDLGQQFLVFLKDWFSDTPYISVRTSGSTGMPKRMQVEKTRMINSAKLTQEFFSLKSGDTALLCMPLDYIAGKMMLVRALVAGLNLYFVTPSAHPLGVTAENTNEHFTFAAMTPMQVFNSLQHQDEKSRLMGIERLIIGGGAVDSDLVQTLKTFPNAVYSTYGMTETLSHIAMRRLSGDQASGHYYPLTSVTLSLALPENTLVIDAPLVAQETLYTNDIAEIFEDGSFQILGRKDNIINSGGIKIQAEAVEELLQPIIKGTFAITSVQNEQYGEIVVLAVEQPVDEQQIRSALPKYYAPKEIVQLTEIPLTETKKIKRAELKAQVAKALLRNSEK